MHGFLADDNNFLRCLNWLLKIIRIKQAVKADFLETKREKQIYVLFLKKITLSSCLYSVPEMSFKKIYYSVNYLSMAPIVSNFELKHMKPMIAFLFCENKRKCMVKGTLKEPSIWSREVTGKYFVLDSRT